jgi:hypothetical protein
MPAWLKIVMDVLPVFVEWLQWVIALPDHEWEDISKAWPAPTKTRLARIRYEAKLHDKFGGDEQ